MKVEPLHIVEDENRNETNKRRPDFDNPDNLKGVCLILIFDNAYLTFLICKVFYFLELYTRFILLYEHICYWRDVYCWLAYRPIQHAIPSRPWTHVYIVQYETQTCIFFKVLKEFFQHTNKGSLSETVFWSLANGKTE